MKITKHEHACFTVELNGKSLIVDPGVYTTDLIVPENVVAVVVTHEHADHFDPAALGAIIAHNPNAVIIAPHDVTRQLGDANETLPYKTVSAGGKIVIQPFELDFYGGEHAIIHPDIPVVANIGVLINSAIFYPGDSFVNPHIPVDVLALPVSAPWSKISETIDYVTAVKPRIAFPTHDAILSKEGKQLVDRLLPVFANKKSGISYQRIDDTPLTI